MLLRDVSFSSPEKNIAFDRVLLFLAESGKTAETLRLWESPSTFIVMGKTGKAEEDVYTRRALRDNIPIIRRSSGGGTVVLGKGCLNFALILSKARRPELQDLHRSYKVILNNVIDIMASVYIQASFCSTSDLVLTEDKRKFSGNAQHRARNYILHHGTILYNFDLSLAEKYLKMPLRMPSYRNGRSHLDFLANVPCGQERLKEAFRKHFSCQEGKNHLTEDEKHHLHHFLEKSFSGQKKALCYN